MIYQPLILSMLLMVPLVCSARGENLLTIESWGSGALELSISVPSGYTIQKHKGPDFDVHYVRLKNPSDPSMGIYIGHHPNPFSSQGKGVETNRRLIYLNAFCNPSKFDRRWEKEIILVKDGGSCYFQVYFDATKKEFIDLHYNGQA